MRQTFGEVHRSAVTVVEQHRVPVSESRRPQPDVDDDVEHRPGKAGHIFGLAGWQLGEVQAAQHTGRRYRTIGLPDIEPVTGEPGEPAVGEPFEEQTTRIGIQSRRDLPRSGDVEFASLHVTVPVVRSVLRWRLSAAPTRIRCRGTSRWWRAGPR